MENIREIKNIIENGEAVLGMEFGSTRIKAVLVGENGTPIAMGDFEWENRLENGYWTYHIDEITNGLQAAYKSLADNVLSKYDVKIKKLKAMGFSAMMHGYLAFDKEAKLLVPFRTWRNTTTERAADILTREFSFNIPQRWSISHLYQAILDNEEHVGKIDFLTTLAGYIHFMLTGKKVLGVGDASGMFPIDSDKCRYDEKLLEKFGKLVAEKNYPWTLEKILPSVLKAGDNAGTLTEKGAKLLDTSGELEAGIPVCPPEGDAGTGMVATDSVAAKTGNVSAGTSIFAMTVLEKLPKAYYREIDMVTTPSGKPVAMVHCNNCTSDINSWVGLFREVSGLLGGRTDSGEAYSVLFQKALEGNADCGGLLSYNCCSGEPVIGLADGRPMFTRLPDSHVTAADFMRALIYSSMASLRVGMEILTEKENAEIVRLTGHGGLFKTKGVAQRFMAAALKTPVSVTATAGEGGPWGMALLAAYSVFKKSGETLEDYLHNKIFADAETSTIAPNKSDEDGFDKYMNRYKAALCAERSAAENFKN